MAKLAEVQKIIKSLRKQGFTRYRIAKESGVDWKTLVNWENGVSVPRIEKYRSLSKFNDNPDKGYLEK